MKGRSVSNFIPEHRVSDIWPILPQVDLRRARRRQEIAVYLSPIGPHYKAEDVESFIERKYRQCVAGEKREAAAKQQPVGHMDVSTSTSLTLDAAQSGTLANTTQETDALLDAAYEQRISNRPKSPSSPSSQQPHPQPKTHRTLGTSAH